MNKTSKEKNKKAWVITADMGYGHQRTAYPLREIAFGEKVINANSYDGIPKKDKKVWKQNRAVYEFISRFKAVPYFGGFIFGIMDKFQKIMEYYPKRDLSKPTLMLKSNIKSMHKGWGRDLIERLRKNPLPIISTFFTPAFMAEEGKYPNQIYCTICDADISRSWAPLNPKKSNIKYFTPNSWTTNRLKLYGVKDENIILTGYPLPKENIGEDMEFVKEDLKNRIINLDPNEKYRKIYEPLINKKLGKLPEKANHPLTILFSIGGAGAQKEMVVDIINNLKSKIKEKKTRFFISVGVREGLIKYYSKNIKDFKLDGWMRFISGMTMNEYFKNFNDALRQTDILWTKPSELSFYSGLGIPIIIAPPIGSQEDFNKKWLLHIGSAVAQEDPKYADQWIFDYLNGGDFAEMAMQGFIEIEKMGTYKIEKIIQESKNIK